jgi:hypothetical protein
VFSYTAKASDVDGDTLSYSLSQAPSGATINSQTGVLTWSPTTAGNYSFAISVSDGKGGVTLQTFSLTVNAPGTVLTAASARIVVQSSTASVASADASKAISYIVVNGGTSTLSTGSGGNAASASVANTSVASGSALVVDWSGSTQPIASLPAGTVGWASAFLGTVPDQRSLAEKTGLVVTVKG